MRGFDSSNKAANPIPRFGSTAPGVWREPSQTRLQRRNHPHKPSYSRKGHADVVRMIFDGVGDPSSTIWLPEQPYDPNTRVEGCISPFVVTQETSLPLSRSQ
jgi:hypothetical protein